MTLIICYRIDCVYNYQRPDKKRGCKRHALGIGVDMKCDSYINMSEIVKEPRPNTNLPCNCNDRGYPDSTGGCPIHGVKL